MGRSALSREGAGNQVDRGVVLDQRSCCVILSCPSNGNLTKFSKTERILLKKQPSKNKIRHFLAEILKRQLKALLPGK